MFRNLLRVRILGTEAALGEESGVWFTASQVGRLEQRRLQGNRCSVGFLRVKLRFCEEITGHGECRAPCGLWPAFLERVDFRDRIFIKLRLHAAWAEVQWIGRAGRKAGKLFLSAFPCFLADGLQRLLTCLVFYHICARPAECLCHRCFSSCCAPFEGDE